MKKHIVCYGDSNTHGYDGDTGLRFDENTRWTCILQKYLGDDYQIIEEGLSGRTTVFEDPLHEGLNGLELITPVLMSHEPVDLLIIMLGTNDTKVRFNCSAEAIGIGLQRLIKKDKDTECWSGTPNILAICPKNIDHDYLTNQCALPMGLTCDVTSEGLSASFKQAAELTGVHYLDANTLGLKNNTSDFMHLDAKSHQKLAEHLSKLIPELL